MVQELFSKLYSVSFSMKERITLNWSFEYNRLWKIIFGTNQFSHVQKSRKPLNWCRCQCPESILFIEIHM